MHRKNFVILVLLKTVIFEKIEICNWYLNFKNMDINIKAQTVVDDSLILFKVQRFLVDTFTFEISTFVSIMIKNDFCKYFHE